MPQVIPLGVAAITQSAVYAAVASVVVAVGTAVYGSAKQRKMRREAKKKYNAGLQDRTITRVTTDAPFRYVYGRTRVGSTIVAIFTSGNKDQYKHLVCVHADHECDGIEEIWVAGKKLSHNRDADGWVLDGEFSSSKKDTGHELVPYGRATFDLPRDPATHNGVPMVDVTLSPPYANEGSPIYIPCVVSGRTVTFGQIPDSAAHLRSWDLTGWYYTVTYTFNAVTSRVRVSTHLGYPGEPADAFLMQAVPTKWTSAHRLAGKCYSVVTLDLNESEFQGAPPSVEVLVRGARLYDFRSGTTYWNRNPVLAIYHYLTSDMCGIPADDLPLARWIAAANVCDEPIGAGPRYTLNGSVTADQAQADVLEAMADAMAGNVVATTWDVSAGTYRAPIKALQKADIVGSWAISPGASEGELFNGVSGQFFSAEAGYVSTDFRPYQNPTYLAADGRELWSDKTFPFTDETWRVHALSRIEMEQVRNGLTFKALFSLKAWSLKVDDRVTLTVDTFGWASKVFIVLDKRYVPVTGAIELTLKEDDPSIWDGVDAFVVDATPNTGLPNPFYVAPLASLSWTSGTEDLLIGADGTIISRIHARWPEARLATGFVEIEWQQVGSDVWQKAQVSVDQTEAYLAPVKDGAFYVVRACCFDPYLNRRSDWTYAPTAPVIGKSAPPSDVPSLFIDNGALSWGQVTDLDLAGYAVRFQYGQNAFWANATPLHEGLLLASPWTPPAIPSGPITLMIKAVDTTGNESANAAALFANLGDPIVENLILVRELQDEAWPSALERALVPGEYDNRAEDILAFSRPGPATYTDALGVLHTAPANQPRFDYKMRPVGSPLNPDPDFNYGVDAWRSAGALVLPVAGGMLVTWVTENVGAACVYPATVGKTYRITAVPRPDSDGIVRAEIHSGDPGTSGAVVLAQSTDQTLPVPIVLEAVATGPSIGFVLRNLSAFSTYIWDSVTISECAVVPRLLIEDAATRINRFAAAPTANESIAVAAVPLTLSFYGAGAVTLSGAHAKVIAGLGAYPARRTYTFTPAAGTLTLAYSGSCADVQLEAGVTASSVIRGSEGSQVTRSGDACMVHGIVGGQKLAGDLVGQDAGDQHWGADIEPYWGQEGAAFWPAATYLPVVYQFVHRVTRAEAGSRLTLAYDLLAASFNIQYRFDTTGQFWGRDSDFFWGRGEAFWPPPGDWRAWSGAIESIEEGVIEFRVSMAGGTQRGVLSGLALQFDVEDESESFNDMAVSAAGLRLPVTKSYRLIKNVSLTLQDDGGTAVTVKCAEKSTSGPLVYCYNSAGTKVAGIIDATIQGVKG